jgi:hypothetical protein
MARSAATWTSLRCEGDADILFRTHWAGLVEVACGECRVMVSYGGRERLAKLPPDSQVELLKRLLESARTEQRNRDSAVVLHTYLERMRRDEGAERASAD